MLDSFDLQNVLFDLFRLDPTLNSLLGITDNTDLAFCDIKIRRTFQDPTLLNPSDRVNPNDPQSALLIPFFDYSFINARETKNYLVNYGILEFNIYTFYRLDALNIYKQIKNILQNNFEDFKIIAEGQVSCPIRDIYCYRMRCQPLIKS